MPLKLRTSKSSFLRYMSGDYYGTENIRNEILIPNTKYQQLFNFACVELKKAIKLTSSKFEFFDFFEFPR